MNRVTVEFTVYFQSGKKVKPLFDCLNDSTDFYGGNGPYCFN